MPWHPLHLLRNQTGLLRLVRGAHRHVQRVHAAVGGQAAAATMHKGGPHGGSHIGPALCVMFGCDDPDSPARPWKPGVVVVLMAWAVWLAYVVRAGFCCAPA